MCSLKKPTHTCSLSIHKSTDTHCRTCTLHYLHIRPHPPLPFECLNCICPLSLTEDKLCFRAVFPLPVLMECQSVHLKMVDQYSYSPLPPISNNSDLCPYKDICYVVSDSHVLCYFSDQTVIRTVKEKWKMAQYPHLRHTSLLWKHMPV